MKQFVAIILVGCVCCVGTAAFGQGRTTTDATVYLNDRFAACAPYLNEKQKAEYKSLPPRLQGGWLDAYCVDDDAASEMSKEMTPSEEQWFNNCSRYLSSKEKEDLLNTPPVERHRWLVRHCDQSFSLSCQPALSDEENALMMSLDKPILRHGVITAYCDGTLSRILSCRQELSDADFERFLAMPPYLGMARPKFLKEHCADHAAASTQKIGVFDFEKVGTPDFEPEAKARIARTVLAPFETLSPSLFSAALVKADASTCDVACQLSAAKVAAVDYAVTFSVLPLGRKTSVKLRLHDMRTAEVVNEKLLVFNADLPLFLEALEADAEAMAEGLQGLREADLQQTLRRTSKTTSPSPAYRATHQEMDVAPSRKRGPAGWRIAAHVTGWLGIANVGAGIALGSAYGWDTDEGLVSGVSSLVIGGGLLIGALVSTINYASKKRRGLYGGIAPALDRPGIWVYGRF